MKILSLKNGAKECICRSRRELSNEYLLAKSGSNTAENEPCKVCPLSAYYYRSPRSPISGVLSLKLPGDLTAASLASPPICNKFEVKNCDDRAKNFLAKNKVDKALTTPLVSAVYLYTGNAIYSDLNKSLREENSAKLKKYLPYLRLFLETFGAMEGKAGPRETTE